MYAILHNFLTNFFGYLRKNLYICRLKSLGNNINLEIRYEYYITEEIGNEGGD
jgi:hypothetical protein